MLAVNNRPVFARINYNLASVNPSSVEAIIERDISITMHEITHALGFSSNLYSTFVDPSTYTVLTGHVL